MFLKFASKMTQQAPIGLILLEIIALNSGQKQKNKHKLPISTGEGTEAHRLSREISPGPKGTPHGETLISMWLLCWRKATDTAECL